MHGFDFVHKKTKLLKQKRTPSSFMRNSYLIIENKMPVKKNVILWRCTNTMRREIYQCELKECLLLEENRKKENVIEEGKMMISKGPLIVDTKIAKIKRIIDKN